MGDVNTGPYRQALGRFREAGWEVAAFGNAKTLIEDIQNNPPRLVVTNLVLNNGTGLQVLEATKSLHRTKVLIVSAMAAQENIKECFRRGAVDFIITPFPPDNLYARLIYHLQEKKEIASRELTVPMVRTAKPSHSAKDVLTAIYDSLNFIAVGNNPHDTLVKLTTQMERIVPINRCSVIVADTGDTSAYVLASNDDPQLFGLKIDLGKYPEVSHVINTGLIVIVDDITKNPLTQSIKKKVKTIKISSIMVLPIRYQGETIGVFSLRSQEAVNPFTVDVARACQAISTSSAHLVDALKELTLGKRKAS